jgi:rubrerythrin
MVRKRAVQRKKMAERRMSPLEFALQLEVKGTALYMKLATAAENPLSKKLFYSLAAEEIAHAAKVDEIFHRLQHNEGWETIRSKNLPSLASELKSFFQRSSRAELLRGAANVAGYELAMNMERKGYKAYSDFHAQAVDATEKAFFKELMAQEKEHLDALANVYSYVTQTDDWLQEEESRVWNWMNL